MHVLIAEDDRISRRMLQRQLEQWGHDVVAAENGVEAWDRFCESEFSIVISDWMMPEMDGLALVQRIRDRQEQAYVYIILVTAKSETDDIVKGMEAGADDFLSKPFDRNELRVRLRAGERIIQLERSLADRNEQLRSVNQRMRRDLEAAADVQQALLPASLPAVPGVNLAWSFRPCEQLAGDFLNVLPLDDRHLALYVADVSGHGVVASLLAVTISHVLTAQASESSILVRSGQGASQAEIASPKEVAKELNRRFPMEGSGGSYFTLVYGVLDVVTHRFRYISAGHPPILRLRPGEEPDFLESGGLAIGWDNEYEFDEYSVDLAPGDRLCIYSDGVPEALNDDLESFGSQRFIEACRRGRLLDLQTAVANLLSEVERWCGASGPKDDVSILAAEIQ